MVCAEYSSTPDLPKGLAFDEDGQIKGIPLELSCAKTFQIVVKGTGCECHDVIRFKIVEPEGGLPFLPSGLKWKDICADMPESGNELTNTELAASLQSKTDFSRDEWLKFDIKFDITGLRWDHWIKSGDRYFQPAVSTECYYSEPVRMPHLFCLAREASRPTGSESSDQDR